MYMRSALPCSTTLVSPPAILTPARRSRSGHGAHFCFQHLRGRPGFENECDHHGLGSRSGYGQIVHRSIHRQFADGAAGKAQRLDHEAIGGDRDARAVDVDVRGIAQWSRGCSHSSGANRPSTSRRLALPPAPCAISICGSRNRILR